MYNTCMEILSTQNEKIKFVKKLQQKKYRNETNLFLVESEKLILEAYNAGYEIVELYVSDKFDKLQNVCKNTYKISSQVMKNISCLVTPAGCVAVVRKKEKKEKGEYILVLENVQDPSNVGAVIRTAFGAGFMTVYTIDCADEYEMKALRSSMGAIFHVNVITTNYEELLLKKDVCFICASMEGENVYAFEKPGGRIGLVIGNEGHGVSEKLRKLCTKTISVPMQNGLESLNAGVSAGLIMYAIKYNLKEMKK